MHVYTEEAQIFWGIWTASIFPPLRLFLVSNGSELTNACNSTAHKTYGTTLISTSIAGTCYQYERKLLTRRS